MFAYCGNDPVNKADPTGCAFVNIDWDFDGLPNSLFIDAGAGGGFAIAGVANSSGMAEDVAYFAKKAGKAMDEIAKKVGNWFASGAEFLWNGLLDSVEFQAQMQYQQGVALQEVVTDAYTAASGFVADRFSTDQKTGNTLVFLGGGIDLALSAHSVYTAAMSGGALAGPVGATISALLIFVGSIFMISAEE